MLSRDLLFSAKELYDIDLTEELHDEIMDKIKKGLSSLKCNMRSCSKKKKKEVPYDIGRYVVNIDKKNVCVDVNYNKLKIISFIDFRERDMARNNIVKKIEDENK